MAGQSGRRKFEPRTSLSGSAAKKLDISRKPQDSDVLDPENGPPSGTFLNDVVDLGGRLKDVINQALFTAEKEELQAASLEMQTRIDDLEAMLNNVCPTGQEYPLEA